MICALTGNSSPASHVVEQGVYDFSGFDSTFCRRLRYKCKCNIEHWSNRCESCKVKYKESLDDEFVRKLRVAMDV